MYFPWIEMAEKYSGFTAASVKSPFAHIQSLSDADLPNK
jgi:hypothetical protein